MGLLELMNILVLVPVLALQGQVADVWAGASWHLLCIAAGSGRGLTRRRRPHCVPEPTGSHPRLVRKHA